MVEQSNYNSGRFINGSLPAFGGSIGALGAPNIVNRDLKNTGIFGSLTWNMTDQLSATAEVRRQRDESTDYISSTLTLNPKTDSTLPRFIIDWKPLDNLKLYASYAEGNRAVTTNPSLAALSPDNLAAFEARYGVGVVTNEETIDNYEIGAKWNLERGYVNVAAYTGKWHDQQAVSSFTYDFNGNGTIDFVGVPAERREFHTASINTGELDVKGVEAEAQYAVTERFLLGANAAWNSSKFTSGVDASLTPNLGSPNVAGKYMALVPRFSGTATATYTAPFGADKDWFVRGDVVYVGSRYSDTSNTGETGASTDLNLVAGMRWSALEISAYVNNVFDDQTVESLRIQGDTGLDPFTFSRRAYEAVLPRRRQFGVAATLRF